MSDVSKTVRPTIAEFAAQVLGIELLPWQREAAEALERGERVYINSAKRSGKTTSFRLVKQWEAAIKELEEKS